MAEPDHTAPARRSGLPDYPSIYISGTLPASVGDEKALLEIGSAITDIEQAKLVITCLLADSDAYTEVSASGVPVQPHSWPLSASTYASLLVAVYFLDECAAMLRHELNS